MKIICIVLLSFAVFTFEGCSTSNRQAEGPAAAVQTTSYSGMGIVTNLDPKTPMIEIDHDDIKGLMPAMQMPFHLKDKSLLDGIKVGDRVEFTVENGISGMQVTAIRKKQL